MRPPRRTTPGGACARVAIVSAFLAAAWIVAAPAVRAEIIDGVAAIVNDDIITLSEVDEAGAPIFREIRQRFGDESQSEIARARREVLDQLVNQKLMEQVIARYEISAGGGEIDAAIEDVKRQNTITQGELEEALQREGITYDEYREQVSKQIQRTKLMHRQVRNVPDPSDEDAEKFYKEHPADFELAEEILVRHVLIATGPGTTEEEKAAAKAKAEEALAEIRAGADLAETAKRISAGPTAADGGSLGWIRRGDTVPDFEAAIFALEKGALSDVVETMIGFHIIRVEGKRAARKVPFAEVKDAIKRRIVEDQVGTEFKAWLDKLRQNAYVEKKL
jgi:peptidyl-prolyl cis-trans isomerase SurA